MDFGSFLNDKLRERGMNLKKLSELTGIAPNHLENLGEGNWSVMPPAPYVYGYLKKIGRVLDFDPEEWWTELKQSGLIKNPSFFDEPTPNRYHRLPKISARNVWLLATVIVFLFAYLGLRFSKILGDPILSVAYPDQNVVVVQTETIDIRGTMKNGDKLTLNGEIMALSADGSWQKNVTLKPGLNTIEMTASKFMGREIKIVRQVFYEPPAEATTSAHP